MADDLQDFWCYDYSTGAHTGKVTKIRIPKICPQCNRPISVRDEGTDSAGNHYADSINNACNHLISYKYIWHDFVVDKIHLKNKSTNKSSGMVCKSCKNYNEYAEPNQNDGTFRCYGCRTGW